MARVRKLCSGECGKHKDLMEFDICRSAHDGLQSVCRVCRRQLNKDYREANKAKWDGRDPYNPEGDQSNG